MSEVAAKEQVIKEVIEKEAEPPLITSKEKNPKNVAAGKLGALSKAAKKKQMQRLLDQEQQSSSYTSYAIVAIGVSVLSFTAYKFLFPRRKEEEFERKVHVEEEEDSPVKKYKKKRGTPISMFD